VYHFLVIRRFYIHNFRCLENFELPISGLSSVLLIGKNGTGKTSVAFALEILQRIARRTNRVGELVKPKDFTRGQMPMRFEIEIELAAMTYAYSICFELPRGFREVRVFEEKLAVNGNSIYTREGAKVRLTRLGQQKEASFALDWHLVALPIVQEQSTIDPLFIFRQWLARMLVLRPMPSLIRGDSKDETLEPNSQVTNFGAWFSGLLAYAPSAYTRISEYLKLVMPDLKDIKNPAIGKEFRSLEIQFANDLGISVTLPFEDLSDGEKCFMICAMVLAAKDTNEQLFCFWDEPDNYLALDEVGHFVLALRKTFQSSGQFIATSHNPEAIRRFSEENTLILFRRSHLEPTLVRGVEQLKVPGDLVGALIRGDIEP
jgi:predicted ATPase